jgi:mRNA-degrading endonuclease RelE of RelBE toxin-antitoxin system
VKFSLVYHPAVESHDLPALDAHVRSRIEVVLEERVATRPAAFGKALRGTLKGLWSTRVGDQRILYTIAGDEVYVLLIGHRRKAYREAPRRLYR